ncbi:hypothetical protein PCOAH_00037250 [Plasmodium coatneyi]|uniref:Uncharacterized protein n=1 Tax=Plasmodium coatneyi TaxID=208452 RepID=A0A1B1E4K5_9APIC|nr:hypothetical protein PCOAH_00037250 [Plasmodium coatneyi]ANQ09962.1 hypothetical protein PCOAH_00037250 [Plasmodium coatneyi]
MPVTTRQNKQGRKGSGVVFRLCTKASLYALLVWIVNCSNSSQYGSNSYNVMSNNGLERKAVDSRTLRLLAEAYEEAIEEDGETTGEVGAEEEVVQKSPSVSSVQERVMQKAPSPSSVQKTVAKASKDVGKTSGKVPKQLLRKEKVRKNDLGSILVQSVDLNEQPELIKRYEERRINVRDNFKPTITANFEEALKRCMEFDPRKHGMD